MDPVRNPYAPGAGNPPPELAGRHAVINDANTILKRIALNRPVQSLILVGLRGVGKTVLLNRILDLADADKIYTHMTEAHEGKRLAELLVPGLRKMLFHLSQIEGAKDKARRGLRVMKSFLKGIRVSINDIEVGLSIDPEIGTADSGDLEADLPELILSVAAAAKAANQPIALFIDELQYLSSLEFSALIMSIHRVNQQNLPFVLIGAGLPQILGLAGNSKSYAERLFKYPAIGALEPSDAIDAIVNPARDEGVEYEATALDEILRITERYPYFLQQWGHESWNIASSNVIALADVLSASTKAVAELDQSFFKVRFDRCTTAEKRYMRGLAEFGSGVHRSGDIAERLGMKTTSVAPTRNNLIKKGMIYSPQHGETAFTVPLFDQYMKRAMPLEALDE